MHHAKTVGDVGEFGLIDRLSLLLGESHAVVGIGDDTAVLERPGDHYLLATVDMLVAGVHFHPAVTPAQIGQHAMAVNISDIGAMGGYPDHALVSLALPPTTPVNFVEELYLGLRRQANDFDVTIVGGNMARTASELAIDVILLGHVSKEHLVLRQGALAGDVLVVSGTLGVTAADRLQSIRTNTSWSWAIEPRARVGQALAAGGIAHAMIDLSDGLASDVHHLCDASHVGAVIYEDHLPVSIHLRRLCAEGQQSPTSAALIGGEDYELLIAMLPGDVHHARELAGDIPLNVIGTVLSRDQGITVERVGGSRAPLERHGWTHF